MTYSLSKEKSAACFYIMQCPGSFNEHEQVHLNFLLERSVLLHSSSFQSVRYFFLAVIVEHFIHGNSLIVGYEQLLFLKEEGKPPLICKICYAVICHCFQSPILYVKLVLALIPSQHLIVM